jgi:replicative DNA helicase
MAMLRESGNIEQDADVIVLLHAPDPDGVPEGRRADYLAVRKDQGKYLEMIVDKNRHGQTGIVPVAFFGNYMRYVPLKERET